MGHPFTSFRNSYNEEEDWTFDSNSVRKLLEHK